MSTNVKKTFSDMTLLRNVTEGKMEGKKNGTNTKGNDT